MKKYLVGVFCGGKKYPKFKIREVYDTFEPKKVFVFSLYNESVEKSYFLTFDIMEEDKKQKLTNFKKKNSTLLLQRNVENNILYTINSLNKIVTKQNGKSGRFKVDWSDYTNCLVLLDKNKNVRKIQTHLEDVVEL